MIRYRKPRAHIGSNDPEQVERWAKEFPDCNWGIEIDRSCITVVDLTRGTRPPAAYGLSSLLTMIGDPFEQPDAVTVEQVAAMAWRHLTDFGDFYSMITDKKSRRTMPGRFERAGYVSVRNPGDRKDGLWAVNRKRQVIYVRKELSISAQFAAAEALIKEAARAAKLLAEKRVVRPANEMEDSDDLM